MVTKKVVITSFEFPWSVKFRPLRPAPSSALGRNMQKCKANAGRGQGVASPAPGKLVTVYPQKKYSGLFSLLFWDSSTHYNAPLLAAIACKHVPWTYVSLSLWQLDPALSRATTTKAECCCSWSATSCMASNWTRGRCNSGIGGEPRSRELVSKRKGPHLLVNRPSLWLGQFDEDGSNSTTFLNITSFVGHTVLRYFGLGKTKFSLFTPPPSVYVGTEGMCIGCVLVG